MKHRIYFIQAATRYQLASTFLRFQEHYESPRFRGRRFTLEEYMDWYAAEYGGFTYYDDWEGFNIPSGILRPFRNREFDPLSKKEKRLLDVLANVREPFYVIGVARPFALPAVKHEFVHGLFYTVTRYRRDVCNVIHDASVETYETALRKSGGYHPSRWSDEINAYSLAGLGDLVEEGLSVRKAKPVQRALREVFREHFGFDIRRASERDIVSQVHLVKFRL